MFETLDDLRDAAAKLGLLEQPPDEILDFLTRSREERVAESHHLHQARLSLINAQIQSCERDLAASDEAKESIRSLEGDLREAVAKKSGLEAELHAIRETAKHRNLRKKREERSRRWERFKVHLFENPLQGYQEEADLARQAMALQQDLVEMNRPEFERRKQVLQSDVARIDEKINLASGRVDRLKSLGHSKTTAGFLIWAGYASFAAVGTTIGTLLRGRDLGAGSIRSALDGLLAWIQGFAGPSGFLQAFGIFLVFLLASLALIAAVTWVSDRFVRGFDSSWENTRSKKGFRRKGEPSLFSVSQLASIPLVERRSYAQLVASFPFVLFAGILFYLLSWTTVSSGEDSVSLFSGALIASYVGTAFALLATSTAILYLTRVMRLEVAPTDGGREPLADGPRVLRHNRELLATLALMAVALLAAGFLPEGVNTNRLVWAFLALFMTAASISLAYGIVLRGLFRDIDILESQRQSQLDKIEILSTNSIANLETLFDFESLAGSLEERRKQREEFEFAELVFDDPLDADSFQSGSAMGDIWFWLRRGEVPQQRLMWLRDIFRKRNPATGPVRAEFEVQLHPSQEERIIEVSREIAELTVFITGVNEVLSRHRTEESWAKRDKAWTEVVVLRKELVAREEEFVRTSSEERDVYFRRLIEFKAAYGVGVAARESIEGAVPPISSGGAEESPEEPLTH